MCVSHERILMRSDRTASLFQTRLGIGLAFKFFVRKANPQRTALGSHPKAGPKSSRSGASPSQTSRLAGRCPATRVTARKTVYTKLPFRHLPNIDTMRMELYGMYLPHLEKNGTQNPTISSAELNLQPAETLIMKLF